MKFLLNKGVCNWFGDGFCSFFCQFDVDNFDDTLFSELEIHAPLHLTEAVKKRRAEFLAGRYCANQSLLQLGVNESPIAVGKHRNPIWPTGVVGSLSHSINTAVSFVSSEKYVWGLGVDVEEILDGSEGSIQNIFATTSELELIHSTKSNFQELLTILFSAKESFFKAAFPSVNRYINFDSIILIKIDEKNQVFHFNIAIHLSSKLKKGMLIQAMYRRILNNQVATLVLLK